MSSPPVPTRVACEPVCTPLQTTLRCQPNALKVCQSNTLAAQTPDSYSLSHRLPLFAFHMPIGAKGIHALAIEDKIIIAHKEIMLFQLEDASGEKQKKREKRKVEFEPESRCEVHPEVVLVVQTLGDRHVWWPILAKDCGDVQFVVSASSSPSQPLVDRVNPQQENGSPTTKTITVAWFNSILSRFLRAIASHFELFSTSRFAKSPPGTLRAFPLVSPGSLPVSNCRVTPPLHLTRPELKGAPGRDFLSFSFAQFMLTFHPQITC